MRGPRGHKPKKRRKEWKKPIKLPMGYSVTRWKKTRSSERQFRIYQHGYLVIKLPDNKVVQFGKMGLYLFLRGKGFNPTIADGVADIIFG